MTNGPFILLSLLARHDYYYTRSRRKSKGLGQKAYYFYLQKALALFPTFAILIDVLAGVAELADAQD
ncbi:hypothetical protein [Lactobacillus delbrueckii]|uniref:hypothetical protein n=1 Tax=Lactobacillus delbrueckii TaxID=1584 RepID=UPI0010706DFC|nr:hypothetical protein [Lactobacillus delbrueckii]